MIKIEKDTIKDAMYFGADSMPGYIRDHLKNIVETHNPNDPCQNLVRNTAIRALRGEIPISSSGALLLTNGARGYNMSIPRPENSQAG